MRHLLPVAIVAASWLGASYARADDVPPRASEPPPSASESPPASAPPATQPAAPLEALPPDDPRRAGSIAPVPVFPAPPRVTFDIDPIIDGSIVGALLGFAATLDFVNSTGEVRAQQIASSFDQSDLLWIDRIAVTQTIHPSAETTSTVGFFAAGAYAGLDAVLDGLRAKSVQTSIADVFIYGESAVLAYAGTNLAKIAVRRPRPIAYVEFEAHRNDPNYSNSDTDSVLSFFSGHSAVTAALGASATYLSFARSPGTVRPWLTLAGAVGLSTFVSIERVRSGAHFPSDVIAGTIAGTGIGILIPHLHRSEDIKQRRVWVGFSGVPRGEGGTLDIGGVL